MNKRTLRILVIVGTVIIIIVSLIYLPPKFINNINSLLAFNSCADLDQETCRSRINCVGKYGPSVCHGNKCTADEVFKYCEKTNPLELIKRRNNF